MQVADKVEQESKCKLLRVDSVEFYSVIENVENYAEKPKRVIALNPNCDISATERQICL